MITASRTNRVSSLTPPTVGALVTKYQCLIPILLTATLLSACAGSTGPNTLDQLKYTGSIQQHYFRHRTLKKTPEPDAPYWLVFIEGDGTPWIENRHIAKDPTPRQPLALSLWKSSDRNALYIGRPCYHGVSDSLCHPRYWTSHRYSTAVIDSMIQAIEQHLDVHKNQKLVIIGHSGGGTIASLLACAFNLPTLLITLSANLDIETWARTKGWSPLSGSRNPSLEVADCAGLTQLHYQGGKDTISPPSSSKRYFIKLNRQPIVIDKATHHNWQKFWPLIERRIDSFITPQ